MIDLDSRETNKPSVVLPEEERETHKPSRLLLEKGGVSYE